jgi:hypothetical protein
VLIESYCNHYLGLTSYGNQCKLLTG